MGTRAATLREEDREKRKRERETEREREEERDRGERRGDGQRSSTAAICAYLCGPSISRAQARAACA